MMTNQDFDVLYDEVLRFVSHAFLIHVLMVFEGKENFLENDVLKNLLFILLAVIIYNLFIKQFTNYVKKNKKDHALFKRSLM